MKRKSRYIPKPPAQQKKSVPKTKEVSQNDIMLQIKQLLGYAGKIKNHLQVMFINYYLSTHSEALKKITDFASVPENQKSEQNFAKLFDEVLTEPKQVAIEVDKQISLLCREKDYDESQLVLFAINRIIFFLQRILQDAENNATQPRQTKPDLTEALQITQTEQIDSTVTADATPTSTDPTSPPTAIS